MGETVPCKGRGRTRANSQAYGSSVFVVCCGRGIQAHHFLAQLPMPAYLGTLSLLVAFGGSELASGVKGHGHTRRRFSLQVCVKRERGEEQLTSTFTFRIAFITAISVKQNPSYLVCSWRP